jgi:hypothetical protein
MTLSERLQFRVEKTACGHPLDHFSPTRFLNAVDIAVCSLGFPGDFPTIAIAADCDEFVGTVGPILQCSQRSVSFGCLGSRWFGNWYRKK